MPPDPSPEITKSDMVRLPASQETSDDQPVVESTSPTALDTIAGYRLGEEIGRGGMGVVYRAHDLALDRDVAVKVLQDRFAPNSSTAQRFVEEAQITGQLQHPGIPAVYAVAKLPDGRPYLAMKLIKGDTLADLLRTKTPVNTLAVFEAIAQAVGYAHAHNVIHRDLKPANVMVGAFGEVQVMDWGLAKVLSETPSPSATSIDAEATTAGTQIRSIRDSDTPLTQYGTAMGTPAYMAPEQAAGEIHKIDKRTDVFGLGALLCTLLTGQPPYLGDGDSVRLKALRGQTEDAFSRLDTCGAEPEVVTLCKQCLSFDSEARPRDGNEVAARIAELRRAADDRAKQAELAQARAEVQTAEQRKRRVVLLYSALTVFVVLTAGITVSLWQAIRATNAEKDTTAQLIKTEEARLEAVTNEERANTRTRELLDSYNQMVFGIQKKLDQRPGTQTLRRELLQIARVGLTKILDEARKHGRPDRTLVWSHFRMGDVHLNLGDTQAALNEYLVGYEMAKTLSEANPKNTEAQHDLSVGYERLGNVMQQRDQSKEALVAYRKSLEISESLADADNKNAEIQRGLSVGYSKLGSVMRHLGQSQEALQAYQKSLKICKRLATADPKNPQTQRDLSISYLNLGDVFQHLGQSQEASEAYEKSMQICERLAAAEGNNAEFQRDLSISYNRLGDALRHLGQSQESLQIYRKSLKICERRAQTDPRNAQAQSDLSVCYSAIGDLMLQLGQTKEALDAHRKTLEIRERMAHADPNNAQAQRALSLSYDNLGEMMLQMGKKKEALEYLEKFNAISERLAQANLNNSQAQRLLGVSYQRLGDVMLQMGKRKEALEYFQKFKVISERLALADPNNAQVQRDLSVCYIKLGDEDLQQGQRAQAIESYQKSLKIRERLCRSDPRNAEPQRDLSVCYIKLGDVNLELGQSKKASEAYQKSLAIFERLTQADPRNAQNQADLVITYVKLGYAEQSDHDYYKAQQWFSKALNLVVSLQKANRLNAQQQAWPTLLNNYLTLCANAEKVIADIEFAFKQPAAQVSELLTIRVKALLKRNKPGEAIVTAERFAAWAEKLDKDRPSQQYNAGCTFALCAAAGEKGRDKLIERSIALLHKAKDAGYFNAKTIAHLKQDSDFNGIRNNAKFMAFVKELDAVKK